MRFYRISLNVIFLLFTGSVIAQMPATGRAQTGSGQSMNLGHFYGKIIDSATNKPVEAASVQLIQNKLDTVTKKRKDVVVAGMLTTKKGEFSLENLAIMASYKLKITAIGYKSYEKKIAFEMNMAGMKSGDMSGMLSSIDKDLGNIKLDIDAQQLQNVTVVSNKSLFTMNIDRKVFNVEKNLTSVGGTAIDVMKNVPSVSVDIDGNVTLRNASPQIFIDGRPTTLTLEQIPADEIASVEIITNPSAKFDASGGGAGILNIVLKKNRKVGYNGNLNASIDSRWKPGLGGDLNVKQDKVNFFVRGRVGWRKSISEVNSERTDFLSTSTAHLNQNNNPLSNGVFGFGRIGMDYFIDNRNTITVGANLMQGQFKSNDLINIERDTVYTATTIEDIGTRATNSIFNFHNLGTTLSFKHNFTKPNKEWTADFTYNKSKNDNNGNYLTQYFYTNGSIKTPLRDEQTIGGGNSKYYTLQTDYVNPISATMKIEMGARAALRDFYSLTNNYIKDGSGVYQIVPGISNTYQFKDKVYAAYTTFSQQLKKISYQLGLRVESSEYNGDLITKNEKFTTKYPLSLFPSAFLTYKVTEKSDLQVNYSRKINRPNFFQLLPFIDYSDPLNISTGNPDLKPEFTNLAEVSYQTQIGKGTSFLTTTYFKNTNDLITSYQYKVKNPDPYKTDSLLVSTYANANTSYTTGLELTTKTKITKWWDFTANFNLFYALIESGDLVGGTNNSQLSWFAKLNNNFKLPKNYSIQLSGDYQAKTILPPSSAGGGSRGGMGGGGGGMFGQTQIGAQGYTKPNYGVDIAIKKDFMKNNAASLTLSMSDIFRTKLYASHAESIYFIQDNERRRDPQILRLSFNWRFGKFDASLFKRKNMKGEMEGMQNSSQGMGNN